MLRRLTVAIRGGDQLSSVSQTTPSTVLNPGAVQGGLHLQTVRVDSQQSVVLVAVY